MNKELTSQELQDWIRGINLPPSKDFNHESYIK